MPLASGSRLGRYEIVAPLAAGGVGEVYRAWDPQLGRPVAIKVIGEASGADAETLQRFEQEARAVAALSHPNVLAIFDVGLGDVPFLVTELLDGETLRAIVERGPLPVRRASDLGLQLASGLAAAHARGIVHRDLKPENIFVTSHGHVKILDFGLAKRTTAIIGGEDATTRVQTMRGTVMGTMGYMSPEQVRGREADPRSDIFAFGAILFEMVTGRRAFWHESPADTMSAILNEPPSSLAFPFDTPPSFVRIVRRCLEKQLTDRFHSARDVALAIESASDVRLARDAPAAGTERISVAVLPFVNMSSDTDHQYFSDGLAEELIIALTRLSGLRVASRTSSFRYRSQDVDIRQIGRDLGVATILEGSVRWVGSRLRISAQLTSATDGYHIWSERYDREMADVFDIQDEIVASIVRALMPALIPETTRAARRQTENLEAYALYLKGRHFWSQRSPAVVSTAIRCFEEAIAHDEGYALAYAGLADCYSILRGYGWTPPEHGQPRALDAVTKALALDPDLPEAHFSKALYIFHFERHWRTARAHFVDALAASPRMAMFDAYFALFLTAEYAYAEARPHLERALALDPHSAIVHLHAASASCVMGDVDAAVRHASRALDLQPESLGPRWPHTIALAIGGRFDEAIAVGEQLVARSRAPMFVGVLAMVYGCAGRLADAQRLARELDERQSRGEYVVPLSRLALHLGLRDATGVRHALAACVEGGAAPSSIIVLIQQLIEPYRSDAEIARLLDILYDGAARPLADSRPG